jgi:hypothetical protein
MNFTLKAFPEHASRTEIISPWNLKTILLNGKDFEGSYDLEEKNGIYIISFSYCQENGIDRFELHFCRK